MTPMDTNENTDSKTQVGLRMEVSLKSVIDELASGEDRTFTNMTNLLLKTHPRVQEILAAQQSEVATA